MAFGLGLGILGGGTLSIIIIAILILVVVYIVFKLGKLLLGLLVNSILGLVIFAIVDYFFNLGIPIAWVTMIPTALFGLPAIATLIILRLFGVPL